MSKPNVEIYEYPCKMMRKLVFIVIAVLCLEIRAALPVELENCSIYSHALGKEVRYSVVLPSDADSCTRYPVVYFLHGIGGDNSTWMEYGKLRRLVSQWQVIAICPDGEESYWSDAMDGSASYERFMIDELIPAVDSQLPTIGTWESRGICGFSMGGFGALTLAMRNPDKFCAVAALSPSVRTDRQYCSESPQSGWDKQWGRIFGAVGEEGESRLTDYYKERCPLHLAADCNPDSLKDLLIIVDTGDKEHTLAASNDALHMSMKANGIKYEYKVRDGGHDFQCWNSAMPDVMRKFNVKFGEKEKPSSDIYDKSRIVALGSSKVVMPIENNSSVRKYPCIYFKGSLDYVDLAQIVALRDSMTANGLISPIAVCVLGENDIPENIEQKSGRLRESQRMRVLVTTGEQCGNAALCSGDNLYTQIVMINPQGDACVADSLVSDAGSYRRYPRFAIYQSADNDGFALGSRLHELLCESKMTHLYRVGDFTHETLWEDIFNNADKRIHD